MTNFIRKNPARIYAVAVAAIPLLLLLVPSLPVASVLSLVAAALALFGGEAVQRTEDSKTVTAYLAPSPVADPVVATPAPAPLAVVAPVVAPVAVPAPVVAPVPAPVTVDPELALPVVETQPYEPEVPVAADVPEGIEVPAV